MLFKGIRECKFDNGFLDVFREILLDFGHQIIGQIGKPIAQVTRNQSEYRFDEVFINAGRVNRVDSIANVIIISIDVPIIAQIYVLLRQLWFHY